MSETIYDIVNNAIDIAFTEDKCELNFYAYLKSENASRKDVIAFLESNLGQSLLDQIQELDMYLSGGNGEQILKEAYEWMGNQRSIKIRNYLNQIIEDAKQYEKSKRPGRKPKTSNK
jgi:hypothetical protein